eukprot:941495-Prorocentrum_minimum.AAC.1
MTKAKRPPAQTSPNVRDSFAPSRADASAPASTPASVCYQRVLEPVSESVRIRLRIGVPDLRIISELSQNYLRIIPELSQTVGLASAYRFVA